MQKTSLPGAQRLIGMI